MKWNASLVNALYIVNDVPPVNSATEKQFPIINTFVAQMNAEAATGDKSADLTTIRSFSLRIWDVLQAQFHIMKGMSGDITASSYLAALNSANNISLNDVLPAWTPSTHLSITGLGSTRYSETNWWLAKIDSGQLSLTSNQPVDATTAQG